MTSTPTSVSLIFRLTALRPMAFRALVILVFVLVLSSVQGVPQRPSGPVAAAGPPRRPVSSSTPVDFSLSGGISYGWLQQSAIYTACSRVASFGTWEAGNVWFQLQGNPTVYWLVLIDQANQKLMPDFQTALKSIERSAGGSQSVLLQFGWVQDPTNRLVVVDFMETTGNCP